MTGGIVGGYRYGSAVRAGRRYSVVWNGAAIERVREIGQAGNPVIWSEGSPLTVEVMEIISQAERASDGEL